MTRSMIGGFPIGSWLAAASFVAVAIAYESRRTPKRGIKVVHTKNAAPPGAGHYSQAVVHGGQVFVSGLLPVSPSGEKLGDRPFEEQAHQVLNNLRAILKRRELTSMAFYQSESTSLM